MNSLSLHARGTNVRPARNRAAAMEGRNALMANRFNELKYNQAIQGIERDNQIKNALAQNPQNAAQIYMQYGDVDNAIKLQDNERSKQSHFSNMQKADAERFKSQIEIFGQVANNIKDEGTWKQTHADRDWET